MDELRKNQNVIIEQRNKTMIYGCIFDYTFDRVSIEIDNEYLEQASKIKLLEELTVTVDTHLGLKKMNSCVISLMNEYNQIILENNPAFIVITKREYSRVKVTMDFTVKKGKHVYKAISKDISGNGIGFMCSENKFNPNEEVEVEFVLPSDIKEDRITINTFATITSVKDNFAALTYKNIEPKYQDKIVKFVFSQSIKQ